eukprot:845537-Pyramimonas_sp.AAC.1
MATEAVAPRRSLILQRRQRHCQPMASPRPVLEVAGRPRKRRQTRCWMRPQPWPRRSPAVPRRTCSASAVAGCWRP